MFRGIVGVMSASAMFFAFLTAAPVYATITVDMVTVGDPGNPGELSGYGYGDPNLERICGAVAYTYQIGKFEITSGQYRAFLNAVASVEDTYGLYVQPPGGPTGAWEGMEGITRTGAPGNYSYLETSPGDDSKPIIYVNYYDCLRFINWLQNGQPVGNQVAGVTETGTYTFSGSHTVTIPDHSTLTAPTYILPNEDEWYKAAFYKGGDSNAGYWDYATQSNSPPDNNLPSLDTGNSANYGQSFSYPPVMGPTDPGAYLLSESAYGTYDQNGNVREWCDMLPNDPNSDIILRGGGWTSTQEILAASYRNLSVHSVNHGLSNGFRVALIPEPMTSVMFFSGGFLFFRRKRYR